MSYMNTVVSRQKYLAIPSLLFIIILINLIAITIVLKLKSIARICSDKVTDQ
jgi:hypothetical protein